MKKITKIVIILVLIVIGAVGIGLYLYNKRPVDVRSSDTDFVISSVQLVTAFNVDEIAASSKYVDKIITVTGKVANIKIDSTGTTVILESDDVLSAVTCSFYQSENPKTRLLKQGNTVKIKGVCTGKLADVVLNKCSIVQ